MDGFKKFHTRKHDQKFESLHEFLHSNSHFMHRYRRRDLKMSHRSLKFLRPVFFLVIILLLYLLFRFPINKILTFLFGLFILTQIFFLIWLTHLPIPISSSTKNNFLTGSGERIISEK